MVVVAATAVQTWRPARQLSGGRERQTLTVLSKPQQHYSADRTKAQIPPRRNERRSPYLDLVIFDVEQGMTFGS